MWWPFKAKWVVLWSLWLARVVRQPTVEVRVSGGWLRGSIAHTGTQAQYLGVPYATVTRRFQEPGPEPQWDGLFDAVDEHKHCIQNSGSYVYGIEQCLILNIYTPIKTAYSEFPVLVFFHGGGFALGTSSKFFFDGGYLTKKDVIHVTINYRLGPLGFMCLGIKEAPGNAGLKDQVAALKWVRKNIRAFGGDPDNVTLFGQSAGAASISYHLLSPMSKGLFHKAILQSGSSLAPWALQHDPVGTASQLATVLGHDTREPLELYNIFMSYNELELIKAEIPIETGESSMSKLHFTPCFENDESGESFLSAMSYNLFFKGNYTKVPMIIGTNTAEGIFFANYEDDISKLAADKLLPKNIDIPFGKERDKIIDRLKETYFSNRNVEDRYHADLVKFFSDVFFFNAIVETTKLITMTNDKPVYFYLFGYDHWLSVAKSFTKTHLRKIPGASHSEELLYLLHPFPTRPLMTTMHDRMTTMWANFAKYGEPIVETSDLLPVKWPVVESLNPQVLYVDRQMSVMPLEDVHPNWPFWKMVYEKYRRKL